MRYNEGSKKAKALSQLSAIITFWFPYRVVMVIGFQHVRVRAAPCQLLSKIFNSTCFSFFYDLDPKNQKLLIKGKKALLFCYFKTLEHFSTLIKCSCQLSSHLLLCESSPAVVD